AIDSDVAAGTLDGTLGNSQPEPGSRNFAAFVTAIKPFEGVHALRFRHSRPCVADGNERMTVAARSAEVTRCVGRVLECVLDAIPNGFPELAAVRFNRTDALNAVIDDAV